ncbi:hypothetical protein ANCDUO_17638 [Ancylostoma duodenale]|uniref:Uncharacterized protein n=1 Tax=Ancylostoma duodenale TaxID=51022 RepID=A0A0C2G5C0_9BILA|nr:hypothetical protein ANCDUO_17638 [Ancylostoma duodenale]
MLIEAVIKIQILEKKREKFVEESEHLQKRIQETAAKKDELIVEASSVRQKINEEGDVLQTLKGKMRSGESKIRDLQSEISNQESKRRGMERSRGSFEQRKQRIIEQIAKFEEESQCEKRKEEAAATRVKMEKITTKETELVERLRSAQQERDELQHSHEQAVSDQNEFLLEILQEEARIAEFDETQCSVAVAPSTLSREVSDYGGGAPTVAWNSRNAKPTKYHWLDVVMVSTEGCSRVIYVLMNE